MKQQSFKNTWFSALFLVIFLSVNIFPGLILCTMGFDCLPIMSTSTECNASASHEGATLQKSSCCTLITLDQFNGEKSILPELIVKHWITSGHSNEFYTPTYSNNLTKTYTQPVTHAPPLYLSFHKILI